MHANGLAATEQCNTNGVKHSGGEEPSTTTDHNILKVDGLSLVENHCDSSIEICDKKTIIVITGSDDVVSERHVSERELTECHVNEPQDTARDKLSSDMNCDNRLIYTCHHMEAVAPKQPCDVQQCCEKPADGACSVSVCCVDAAALALGSVVAADKPLCAVVGAVACRDEPVPCDVCKYSTAQRHAVLHCNACSINYCQACNRDHTAHRPFENHTVVPVGPRCQLHHAEHLKYYCTGCTLPLCTVCVVTQHQQHATLDLHAAAHTHSERLEGLLPPLGRAVAAREAGLLTLADAEAIRLAAFAKTQREIEQHTAQLCAELQTRQRHLVDTLHVAHSQAMAKLSAQRQRVTEELTNMKSLWQFAAKLLQPEQALQLLAMHADVMRMLHAVDTRAVDAPDTNMPMFVPKQQLTVGELQSCQMPLGRREQLALTAADRVVAALPPPPPAVTPPPLPTVATWRSAKRRWCMGRVGEKVGEVSEAYDVAVCDGGTVVVAEWLNQRLQLFDAAGYTRHIIGQSAVQPWGVAVTLGGQIAVTDERDRTVKLFSVGGGEVVATWERGLFGWPRGIAATPAGHYVVCDAQHGQHSVSVHLGDGACLHRLQQDFHWPRYVAVDHRGRIFVSDSSNHCVKVFSPDGSFLFRFGSHGAGPAQMCHPRGVCVDPAGNLLLADQDNKRVNLYSGDGKLIHQLLSFEQPVWGLALGDTGLLAVTQKRALSLYQLS